MTAPVKREPRLEPPIYFIQLRCISCKSLVVHLLYFNTQFASQSVSASICPHCSAIAASMLLLPPDILLSFYAEGGANIVYRLRPSSLATPATPPSPSTTSDYDEYGPNTPLPTEIPPPWPVQSGRLFPSTFEGKLLRLRKNLPTTTPVIAAQECFEEIIKPLFKDENLVDQVLVQLPLGLVENLNMELKSQEKEGGRDARRKGTWLDEAEEMGVLITDMSPEGWSGDGGVKCVEFKPKWLAQSPSAPQGARRCRTCALMARRAAVTREEQEGQVSKMKRKWGSEFCPLDLAAKEEDRVMRAVEGILAECRSTGLGNEDLRNSIVEFLGTSGLLQRLREIQVKLDPNGVFEADVTKRDFLTAMTLRDCSLFLRVDIIVFTI